MQASPEILQVPAKVPAKPIKPLRILSGGIMLIGIAMISLHSPVEAYMQAFLAPGHIYIPNATYKAPVSQKGGIVTHRFRIYNLQAKTLQVEAEPDCSCTNISWRSASIQPFSWKEISASMQKGQTGNSVAIAFHTDNPYKRWLFAFLKT